MARYQITSPSGGTYEITAPDDATQEQVLAYARRSLEPAAGGAGKFAPADLKGASIREPGLLEDAAKSAGAGLARGVMGLAGLPGNLETLGRVGINAAAGSLGASGPVVKGAAVLPTSTDIEHAAEPITGTLYKPRTTLGRYAGAIGEFAPGALFPGGLAQRVLGNVVGPAVASETAGEATKGTSLEPWARIAGAIGGSALPNVAARAYTPAAPSAQRAQAVAGLRAEGVTDLTAGQVTGARPLQWLEQSANDIPFTSGRAATIRERQLEQFTEAALKRTGTNARRADKGVIDGAFDRLGTQFDQLAQASQAALRPADRAQIGQAVTQYERMTPPAMQAGVVRAIADDIATHAGNPIPGPVYQRYRSEIERVARGTQDHALASALRDIRTVLDDAVERALPQAQQGAWRETRNQYRNLLVVERAATAAGADTALGLISPAALRNATIQVQGRRNYARGRGDFDDLARDGTAILSSLPQSGTAPRAAAMNTLNALGAAGGAVAGGGASGGDPFAAGFGALAGPVLTGLAMRGAMSRPVQAYLGANARGLPMTLDARGGAIASAPNALSAGSRPLQVYVYPEGDPRNGY